MLHSCFISFAVRVREYEVNIGIFLTYYATNDGSQSMSTARVVEASEFEKFIRADLGSVT